jgi:hypothetical protein
MCGIQCLGLDLRADCTEAGESAAEALGLGDRAHFATGDMRLAQHTVQEWAASNDREVPRFGGMFTSIPFWKLETYDAGGEHPDLMEHCKTFVEFTDALHQSLKSTVNTLADNAWVLVHCGPMRHGGKRRDIPFEVKKILLDLELEIIDEIVLMPPANTNMMRAARLYKSHCKLINANSRIVVAWKVRCCSLDQICLRRTRQHNVAD